MESSICDIGVTTKCNASFDLTLSSTRFLANAVKVMFSTNNFLRCFPLAFFVSDSVISAERYQLDRADSTRNQSTTVSSTWAVVDKLSTKFGGYNFIRGDRVLLCDPSDSKKQIIRYIRCTSNEWIRVSNKGGIQFVFIPRGYCGVDKGSGVESSICSQSFEVVPLGLVKGTVLWPLPETETSVDDLKVV